MSLTGRHTHNQLLTLHCKRTTSTTVCLAIESSVCSAQREMAGRCAALQKVCEQEKRRVGQEQRSTSTRVYEELVDLPCTRDRFNFNGATLMEALHGDGDGWGLVVLMRVVHIAVNAHEHPPARTSQSLILQYPLTPSLSSTHKRCIALTNKPCAACL